MLVEFFWKGGPGRRLWAAFGLAVFLGHQVFKAYLAWAINGWYEQFYDLMQGTFEASSGDGSGEPGSAQRAQVYASLWDFAGIVMPAVVVHPLAGLIRNWWVFSWRRALMRSYLHCWNTHIPVIEGASQRVHEDTQRFASGIQSCLATVLQSLFTLVVFCPVLYDLDPGLMGAAAAAAIGGLSVSVLIGWPLVGLEVNNQKVEAELRKRLVLLETAPSDVHTVGTPYTQFMRVFGDLTRNYRNLYCSFAALSTWLSLYEQIAVILPYALVAPRLFAADPAQRFTLGKLVKVSNSFGRVFDSLNVVSDRWLEINEWRSCLRRLREFEREVGSRSPAVPVRLTGTAVELAGDPHSRVVEDADLQEPPWIAERQDAGRV